MRRFVATLSGALLIVFSVGGGAEASPVPLLKVVSTNPADFTPRVTANSAGGKVVVQKMTQVGSTMFAGGGFTQVQDAARTNTYNRTNLFSFNASTGAVNPLSVSMDGTVWALASDGTSLYVGGTFTTVNGVARRGLVKMNATTGVVDTSFNAQLNGNVYEAQVVSGRLIISGSFTKRLSAVNLLTGADTGYINLSITGDVDGPGGWVPRVYRFAVDPGSTRLVAIGNFLTVNGVSHPRAFMVDLNPAAAALSPWNYAPLERSCAADSILDYLRDVDFSPDGAWFVIVSSGFVPRTELEIGTSLCDAAARFETANLAPTVPTWINYTGGDTLQATTVTAAAVYVQGHNRWLDNPQGRDTCVGTCVPRPGIGAIDPNTGRALSWNPTKDRKEGGKDLLVTAQGLWVSSDTTRIGGEIHERVALMPATP